MHRQIQRQDRVVNEETICTGLFQYEGKVAVEHVRSVQGIIPYRQR